MDMAKALDRVVTPELPAYYTHRDLPHWASQPGGENPGQYPFVRGIDSDMYRRRLWRIRQYAGFGTSEETNLRWKLLLAQGQDGISCAFDLPTQLGLDSDDPRAASDVGRLGVAIDTLEDFLELFDGIPLDATAATFNINSPSAVILAMLLEAADRQGCPTDRLTGTLSNDPLIEFAARGLWRLPPGGAMRLVADTFAYASELMPRYYPMNLRGTLVYEAGGTDIEELGFAMACAVDYLDQIAARGADLERATARFSFMFFADTNVLEVACKMRAARMLWAELVSTRYGVKSASGQKLRFTAPVGNFNLRAQYPELNLVRNALGALGAVLGGCQAMLVAGMDEAFEIPSERNALIGLYTQQVLAYESHVPEIVDPLGGSYYVEATTERLRAAAQRLLDTVIERGGAVASLKDGFIQRAIADSAYRVQLEEESGQRLIVGVNTPGSVPPVDPDMQLHEHDETILQHKRQRLAEYRRARDRRLVSTAQTALKRALETDENVIPRMREALRAQMTIGEIMEICVGRYGEYSEAPESL
jgi:methylmalonyl-CoA mutase N-terminal domain/subunit